MTASPDLFCLIKSLTPSEKRYFKIFASKHVIGNKNNYEKLFDAFDALPPDKEYDEAAFKRSLKTKSWVKNFAVEKNLLEDLILKALRSYSAEKTPEGKLHSLVTNIRLLFDKGLIDAAKKTLAKAFEEAREQASLSTLILLYQYKLQLTGVTLKPEEMQKVKEDFEADTRVMKMLDIERRTFHIRRNVILSNLEEARKWINELDALESFSPISIQAKLNNLTSRAWFLEMENRRVEALEIYRQIITLHKEHEKELSEPTRSLRKSLGNYVNCAINLLRLDEIPAILETMEQLPAATPLEMAEAFRFVMHYKLFYYLNTPTSGAVDYKEIILEAEKGLKKYAALIPAPKLIHFRFNICALYFKYRDYDGVISAANKAFNAISHIGDMKGNNSLNVIGRSGDMKAVIRDLKYMEAAAHINLKNYDLVDYYLRNMERWLREHELNNDFTSLLHKILRKMMQPGNHENIRKQLINANCPEELLMLREIMLYWLP